MENVLDPLENEVPRYRNNQAESNYRRKSHQVPELQSHPINTLEFEIERRERGDSLFDHTDNSKNIANEGPVRECHQIDLSADNSEEFNELDIDEASNSNHFIVYDQQSIEEDPEERSLSVRLDIDAYNEEEVKRAMAYQNPKITMKNSYYKGSKTKKIVKNPIYYSPRMNLNGQGSPMDSSLRKVNSRANMSSRTKQGSDRNRCNSGYKASVKDRLIGSKNHNTTSKKLPYGLNQRRSLEDLGVPEELKVFSPVADLNKNGIFINKEYYQNPYLSNTNSKVNLHENSDIQKSKKSRNGGIACISPKFLTFDKKLCGKMHQSNTSRKLQNEIARKLCSGGSGFLTKQQSNPSLESSVRENLSPKLEKYKSACNNNKSRNNHGMMSQTSKTFESFYSSQMEYQRKKLTKAQQRAEQKIINEQMQAKIMSNMRHTSNKKGMFKVKSKYLNYKKPQKNYGELEYDPKSRNQIKKSNTSTFIPQINKKSKMIKRELNISDHLYRDASNRQLSRSNKRISGSPIRDSKAPKTHKVTGKYLWKKLRIELQKCIDAYSIQDPITYEEMGTILLDLGYIPKKSQKIKINGKIVELTQEIVKILKIPQQISQQVYGIDNQDVTTLAITKAFLQYLCSPSMTSKSPKRHIFRKESPGSPEHVPENTGTSIPNQLYSNSSATDAAPLMPSESLNRQHTCLTPHQKYKLSKLAFTLCDSRREFLAKLAKTEKIRKMNVSPSFMPCISSKSLALASQIDKSQRTARKENLPREALEVQKCTFQPKLGEKTKQIVQGHKETVFKRLAQAVKKKRTKEYLNFELEQKDSARKNKRYKGKIRKKKETKRKEAVVRMEADEEKEEQKEQKSGILDLKEEKASESIPQLFIDVHLDDKSIHRLTIFEGDDPKDLAQDFCTKHDLDESMLDQLVEIINSQLEKLLNTIQEDEGNEDEGNEDEDE
ncbi:unnamed protein product [Moneuplotes crassus]|uniref:Uncharacterized protein n=1 Tax=Euplotes crassus TaxID=5936 RepID=A0AAD1XKZ8_EUPCR|nr:unnamed protein product [Moneuplotes crassus]